MGSGAGYLAFAADAAGHDRDKACKDAAGQTLADAGGHIGKLATHEKDRGARYAFARLLKNRARRHLGAAGARGDTEIALQSHGSDPRRRDDAADPRLEERHEEFRAAS